MTVKENLGKLENYLISHKVKGTNRSLINIEECIEMINSIQSVLPNSLDESEIIWKYSSSRSLLVWSLLITSNNIPITCF